MIDVSVVVSAFQSELYLVRCVESILKQKNINIEIIIIINGATDSTVDIATELSQKHKNIVVLNLPRNIPLSDARNIGCLNAMGEYIAFVDSDDEFMEDALSTLYYTARKNNSDLVLYHVYHITQDTITEDKQFIIEFDQDILSDPLNAYFLRKIHTTIWSKFVKRKYIFKNKVVFPPHILWCEDTVLTASLLMYSPKITLCNEFLYKYYIHSSNTTSRGTNDISDFKVAIEFVMGELKKNGISYKYKNSLPFFINDIIDWGKKSVGDNEELKEQLNKYYYEWMRTYIN